MSDFCDPMDCVAPQAPVSLRFPKEEYGSGLPFPSAGDLPDPGIESTFPALQVDSLLLSHQGSPELLILYIYFLTASNHFGINIEC